MRNPTIEWVVKTLSATFWLIVSSTLLACSGKTYRLGGEYDAGPPATGGAGGIETGPSGAGASGVGGSNATGGTGGVLSLPPADKIDLLFVVDNSASMARNQAVMSGSIAAFVNRLVNPDCVDAVTLAHIPGVTPCPAGTRREFAPVTDLHIGVVTSSIGGHGADLCSAASSQFNPEQDDRAHLLPSVRTGLPSFNNQGFLAWNPQAGAPAGSLSDPATLLAEVTGEIDAAGELGCGYEGTLEAMYRFLIDPDPPSSVTQISGAAIVTYPDATVLAQRAAFLRPDSLVGIVVLSDENDCSIVDGDIGWIIGSSVVVTRQFRMPAATSTCATDANSPCCRSCGVKENTIPAGCVPLAQDPVCFNGGTLSATDDPLNLRCWDQKRRFGIDLLYPVQRYVSGLTARTVKNRAGNDVPNPLFFETATSPQRRDASRVFTLGIVGVPWQDVATPASLTGTGLEVLTAQQLNDAGRWPVILGDPSKRVAPLDKLMVESESPRVGTSPIIDSPLAPATSQNPQENPINGHEYTPSPTAGDLQYACIYQLPTPVVCTATGAACDCVPDSNGGTTAIAAANRPLCQPPSGGSPGTTQYYAKAYPGLRELQLLRDLGDGGIVASLCAKDPLDTTHSAFGFKPAFDALINRMGGKLVAP